MNARLLAALVVLSGMAGAAFLFANETTLSPPHAGEVAQLPASVRPEPLPQPGQGPPPAVAPEDGSVSGTVKEEGSGAGVAAVSIFVYPWKPRGLKNSGLFELPKAAETTTDPAGGYVLKGLAPGAYTVACAPTPGFQENPAQDRIRVEVEPGRAVEGVHFVLRPGIMVAGRVIDDARQPVEGAEVRVRPRRILWRDPANRRCVTTNAKGEFAFREAAVADSVSIEAVAPGFAVTRLQGPDGRYAFQVPPQGLSGLEIALAKGRSFEGRVVDEAGAPVPNALVHAMTPARGYVMPLTNKNGFFRMGGFPFETTEVKLGVSLESGVLELLQNTDIVRFDSERHKKEVRLVTRVRPSVNPMDEYWQTNAHPRPGMTTGTLIDVDGKTVDGAELSVGNFVAGFQAGHPDTFYSGVLTKTGPEGKFALDFRGQRQADVCLNAEGYMHETFKGIRSGSEDNILTAHPSIGVQGRILDGKTGQPITLFTVEPLGPGDKECISGELHASPEFSGCERIFHAEGRFTVYSQHPEKIKLCAWAPGYAPMQQEIALNRTGALAPVEFRLERERTITGVVQDAAGNPIEGARVFSLPSATAVTGSDGRFELTGLGAAVCEVFPVGRKYAGHKVQVDLTQASTQEIILTIEPE